MKLFKISLTGFLLMTCIGTSLGQSTDDKDDLIKATDVLRSKKLTSLNTDILPEVLSTAINNGILSASGTSIKLNATIFGLKKLFDTTVAIDRNYIKETFNRNLSFGAGINIDNTNRINGFQLSLKYALVNHRDISMMDDAHLPGRLRDISTEINKETGLLVNDLFVKIVQPLEDAHRRNPAGNTLILPAISDSVYNKLVGVLVKFTNSQSEADFKNIEQAFRPYRSDVAIDASIFAEYHEKRVVLIDSLASRLENEIKRRGVVTLSANSNYINKNWDSVLVKLEWIKGIGGERDSTKPWDIYAAGFFNFKKDTLTKHSLQRQVLTMKLGVNKVLATRKDGGPLFEILGAAEGDQVISGRYTNEKKFSLLGDFTFTVKISKAISVPLEIKYDPAGKGNLFGFLNFKWDILTSPKK